MCATALRSLPGKRPCSCAWPFFQIHPVPALQTAGSVQGKRFVSTGILCTIQAKKGHSLRISLSNLPRAGLQNFLSGLQQACYHTCDNQVCMFQYRRRFCLYWHLCVLK